MTFASCLRKIGQRAREYISMWRRSLEVVAHNTASESIGIDGESLWFVKLRVYKLEIPHMISSLQYNDRRKFTASLCFAIREKMADIDGGEDYFMDSKPIESDWTFCIEAIKKIGNRHLQVLPKHRKIKTLFHCVVSSL